MASSPLRLSLTESSKKDEPRSHILHGLDADTIVPIPEWVRNHVQAEAWIGPRLAIEALSQAATELEKNLHTVGRMDLPRWLSKENALEIDPALVFLILARDLRDLGIAGDLAIGG